MTEPEARREQLGVNMRKQESRIREARSNLEHGYAKAKAEMEREYAKLKLELERALLDMEWYEIERKRLEDEVVGGGQQ